MTKTLNSAELAQFTGGENWYRHGINRPVLFTDGAKYIADQAGAYWLLDEIAIIQRHDARIAGEAFQVWKLAVAPRSFLSPSFANLEGHVAADGRGVCAVKWHRGSADGDIAGRNG